MLSFANIPLSFYFLLLCIAGLAASAPTTYHRHLDSPFPYGKLADKLLNVNHVSFLIDNPDDEDREIHIYPEDHYSIPPFPAPPTIASSELKPPTNTIRTKDLFLSFAHRIPDMIKRVVDQEWDTALQRDCCVRYVIEFLHTRNICQDRYDVGSHSFITSTPYSS